MAQKKAEESRLRKERGQKMRMDDKKRELEELKPKARSALAARWEESVKSQSSKGHTATVLTGHIKGEDVSRRGVGLEWVEIGVGFDFFFFFVF